MENKFQFSKVCFRCTKIHKVFFWCTTFVSFFFNLFYFNASLKIHLYTFSKLAQAIPEGFQYVHEKTHNFTWTMFFSLRCFSVCRVTYFQMWLEQSVYRQIISTNKRMLYNFNVTAQHCWTLLPVNRPEFYFKWLIYTHLANMENPKVPKNHAATKNQISIH